MYLTRTTEVYTLHGCIANVKWKLIDKKDDTRSPDDEEY